MKEPAFVAGTLAWCNRQREKKGKHALKRLPKGRKGDGYSCPCGKATGLFVGAIVFKEDGVPWQDTPEPVCRFVAAFDGGDLPQYEA